MASLQDPPPAQAQSEHAPNPSTANSSVRNPSSPYAHLPLSFRIFAIKANSEPSGHLLCLGRDAQHPQHAITIHHTIALHETITLHTTLDAASAVLASAQIRHGVGRTVRVTIPSAATTSGADAVQETMSRHAQWQLVTEKYDFEIATGGSTAEGSAGSDKGPPSSPPQHRETFEWRHTPVPECRIMGAPQKRWQLYRVVGGPAQPSHGDDETLRSRIRSNFTSTHHNARSYDPVMVAMWTMIFAKPQLGGHFQFWNAGADGQLGEVWALMAVMSALSIGKFPINLAMGRIDPVGPRTDQGWEQVAHYYGVP